MLDQSINAAAGEIFRQIAVLKKWGIAGLQQVEPALSAGQAYTSPQRGWQGDE